MQCNAKTEYESRVIEMKNCVNRKKENKIEKGEGKIIMKKKCSFVGKWMHLEDYLEKKK